MEKLPIELIIIITSECDIKTIAAFRCCSKALNSILTPVLYHRNIKENGLSCVLFAFKKCANEKASISILKNAVNANVKLEIEDTVSIPNIFPQHPRNELSDFLSTPTSYRLDILALAISQSLNDVANFLLKNASFIRDERSRIKPMMTKDEYAEHMVTKPLLTPLLVALSHKNAPIIARLLEMEVFPNSIELDLSPFIVFVVVNNPEYITNFLINGQGKNKDTSLFDAIGSPCSNAALISILTCLGANIHHTTLYKRRSIIPFVISCAWNRWEEAMVLANHGINLKREGFRLLEIACLASCKNGTWKKKEALMKLLIEKGADPNNYKPLQQPLIIKLVRRGLDAELRYLLQHHHLKFNVKDAEGNTALDWALLTENPAETCASLLFEQGANFPNRAAERLDTLIGDILNKYETPTLFSILVEYKKFAQSYHILFNYCSTVSREKVDLIMRNFINRCPRFLRKLIKDKRPDFITNKNITDELLYAGY
jgi:hypothetical protein